MHLASDMLSLRHRIEAMRHEREEMIERLHHFGMTLRADTAKMLSAMRHAMDEDHARMREMRGDFNSQNQRSIKRAMHALQSERASARRNWMGERA
jgi:hypothetical protein